MESFLKSVAVLNDKTQRNLYLYPYNLTLYDTVTPFTPSQNLKRGRVFKGRMQRDIGISCMLKRPHHH